MCQTYGLKGCQSRWAQLCARLMTMDHHPSTNFEGQTGCRKFPLGLLITMVPSVRNESAQIVDKLFYAKRTNFVGGSKPKEALFWGNDLEFILVARNYFQRCIICLYLNSFTKIHNFWDSLWNWQLKYFLILHIAPTGTRNQDLRPLLDSFHHDESNGSLRFDKRPSVQNYIFRGEPYCLDLHEISITWSLWLYFGNQAYP